MKSAMKFVKIAICAIVCVALIFLTYRYINKPSSSGAAQAGGPGGAPAGQAPAGQQGGRGSSGGSGEQGGGRASGGGKQQGGSAQGSGGGAPSGGKNAAAGGAPGGGASASKSQNVTSVRTQIAEVTALQDYVFTTGEIAPLSTVAVYPEIGGKVVRLNVEVGSKVKKGDVLMKVDPSSPGMEYALNSVTAPISGTIMSLPARQGTTVTVNASVATIGDVSNLELTANVPERYVSSLRNGLKADVTLEAYPEDVFKAHIIRQAPALDTASRTKEVTLTFDSPDARINAGMFAKVKLFTDVYDGSVTIPSSAVIERSGKKYVFVLNGDGQTVAEREVTTGKSVDNVVQLLTGVDAGDRMVVEGMRVLGNGSTVRDIGADR